MAALGIEGSYAARRAGRAELAVAVEELRSGALDGINVTMPLKREAARIADRLTSEAEASGSVNTMRHRRGRVEGHSTDVVAARRALADSRFDPEAPILVLGSGGAAAAVLIGGAGRALHLEARNEAAARGLAARSTPPALVQPFGQAVHGAVVVNATPLGMAGESLPEPVLAAAGGLIDLAYGDGDTPAVIRAREVGLPFMDGVEFLVLQAAGSFEWWSGIDAPLAVMLEAARKP